MKQSSSRDGTGSSSLTLGDGEGSDSLLLGSGDRVRAGNGDDRVSGGCGLVSLTRGGGHDRIAPGGGNSVVLGNGDDTIAGGLGLVGLRVGDGCDRIRPGGGGDMPVTLTGGSIDIGDDAPRMVWELAVLPLPAGPSGLRSDSAGGSLPGLGDGGVLHVASVAPVSLHDLPAVPGH